MRKECAVDESTAIDAGTRHEVEALLARIQVLWQALDFERSEELWDRAHAPLYIAEEDAQIHTSFESLRRYWRLTHDTFDKLGLRMGPVQIVALAPDLITIIYPMYWDGLIKGRAAPVGGEVRATAVLRRVDRVWKFTQWVEAPLAPPVYLRMLYERSVTPGFGAG
jgi:hypothetical protein